MNARVWVIGAAGAVGAAAAADLARLDLVADLFLVDRDTQRNRVRQLDLRLRSALTGGPSINTGRLDRVRDGDLLVVAASVPHRDGCPRLEMFRDNAAVIEAVLGALPGGWIGTVLIATNPVDPLCTLASRRLSPDATVLGYSLHDSLRLTEGIAIVLGCAASEVTAWVVGEHGPDMVPLFEHTQLHGHPVVLDQRQRHEALTHALNWYDNWQRCGTGMTSALCSGTGIAHMLERLLAETTSVLPACAQLRGEYGLSGVSLGVPVRLGRGSAEVEQWQLTKGELAAMHRSSQVVAGVVG